MKIFVPVPSESILGNAGVKGQLVPFHPDYLEHSMSMKESRKPSNWVEKADYTTASQLHHSNFSNT
jgi:hypothetical protein